MVKKGDTLIEVVLAVGIFSLVAIAVASVMNGGTSSAQSSLEITLAREEIDAQAEALRFIQASYIADKDAGKSPHFSNLWQLIKDHAVRLGQGESSEDQKLLSFSPQTCDSLYAEDGEVFKYNAFILNHRKMGEDLATTNDEGGNASAYVSATSAHTATNTFHPTVTYPRVLFEGEGVSQDALYDADSPPKERDYINNVSTDNAVSAAEGIYIIAVEDASNTTIVSKHSQKQEYAFYDFYIRSCWYGTDSDHPSTISTVIRLYNPDALDTDEAN